MMKRKLQSIQQALFGSDLDLWEKTVRIVLVLVFFTSCIGLFRFLRGMDWRMFYARLGMVFVSGISLKLAIKDHKLKQASWLLVVASNVFLYPVIFVLAGGIGSGTPLCFVMGFVCVFLFFKGKEFAAAFFLSVAGCVAAFVIAYRDPQLAGVGQERLLSHMDTFGTIMITSCFVGIMNRLQTMTYDREKRRAERQKEELEQMARSKDNFFANMSHEIRTPINTIIGLNEMTLREDISEEIAENAINIQNASKMLLTTINDILDLSKLESGKMEIMPTQYEFSGMLSDLVNLIWIRAHQKELEFKVDIDPNIPSMLYGDEVRIKQVITNMLTNAVKYTDAGSITLSAQAERLSPVTILLRISVKDTGKGIRKESLDDLFRSFKRVDETVNRNIEGTGLGLSISKQLLDMMGGRIYVDSVYHKGSTFTIELQQDIVNSRPIGVIDFAAQKQIKNRAAYRQKFVAPDARVLVVDDNDMNRMVAVKLLRATKVRVDTVGSGRECLNKTAAQGYHVILMDHMMPEMDGEETLHAIRAQTKGYCQKAPVIALTANVMANADRIYQEMGFDGYLAKPINTSLLEAALMKYLPPDLIEFTASENEISDAGGFGGINQVKSARKRKIAVTADCICDLPEHLLSKYQIRLMYCYVHTKEGRFCDISEVSSDSLLEYLKIEGNYAHSSTAPPSEYEYFFADTLGTAEQVIHITATTDLSGAYPYALQASKSFDNVTVIDSGHISSGHGLMVLYAAKMAEEGRSVKEIKSALEKFSGLVCSNFLVPSTEALHRNGKVSSVVHKISNAMKLHPVLYMSHNKLKVWRIEVGNMQRVNRKYVKRLLRRSAQIDTRVLFLTYAGCSVRQLDEIVEEVQKYVDFQNIIVQKASATVSSNCGVGTFGLMFIRSNDPQ
mgnify:CR=1 FL=1